MNVGDADRNDERFGIAAPTGFLRRARWLSFVEGRFVLAFQDREGRS
jgi:hypothetical protein